MKPIIPSINYHITKACNMKCKFCFATFNDLGVVKHDLKKSKKIISDAELIKKMPDSMFIPDQLANSLTAKIFNKTISNLSKITKYFI